MTASPAFIGLASGVVWSCVFAVIHVVGWRSGRGNAGWLLTSYAFAIAGTLLTAAAFTAGSHALPSVIVAVAIAALTSACLFVLYVPAVYTVLTSLSVQTMIILRQSGGAVATSALYERFAGRTIAAERLAILAASGYLIADGAAFRLTPRGRAMAKVFEMIKRVWNLGPGG